MPLINPPRNAIKYMGYVRPNVHHEMTETATQQRAEDEANRGRTMGKTLGKQRTKLVEHSTQTADKDSRFPDTIERETGNRD